MSRSLSAKIAQKRRERRERAMDALIARWKPQAMATVVRTARLLGWYGPPSEEQFAAGMTGLLSAITKYDGARGAAFGSYVFTCVKYAVIKATNDMAQFRTYTKDARATFTSLDQIFLPADTGGDGTTSTHGCLRDDSIFRRVACAIARDDENAHRMELQESLQRAMRLLTPDQLHIIQEHDGRGRTLTDMAAEAEVSKMKMSRMRAGALRVLREAMEKEGWN